MKFAEIGPVESSRTCMSSDGPVGLGLTSLTPEESPLETLMGKAKILLAKYMRLPEHPDGSWIMMSEDIPHFSKVSAFPIDLFFTPAFKVGLITEQDRGAIERIALDLPSKAYPKLKIISELLTTLLSNQGIVEELSSKAAAWRIQVPDNFSSLADTTAGSIEYSRFRGVCDSLTEQIAALDFLRNNSDLDSLIPADELLSLKSLNIEESVAAATKLRTELEATYRLLGVHSVISDFESNLEVLSNAGKTPSGTFFDASEFLGAGKKLDESSRQQRAFLIDASKKSRPFSNEFRVELVDVYMAFDINVAEVNKTVAKCTANAKTQRDYVNYMARNPDLGPIS